MERGQASEAACKHVHANAKRKRSAQRACVLQSIPDIQQPYPGWLWYQPTRCSCAREHRASALTRKQRERCLLSACERTGRPMLLAISTTSTMYSFASLPAFTRVSVPAQRVAVSTVRVPSRKAC